MKWLKTILLALVPVCILATTFGMVMGLGFSSYDHHFEWFALVPAGIWGVIFLASIYGAALFIGKIWEQDVKAKKKAQPDVKHIHVTMERRPDKTAEEPGPYWPNGIHQFKKQLGEDRKQLP